MQGWQGSCYLEVLISQLQAWEERLQCLLLNLPTINNLINQINDLASNDVTIITVQSCRSPHCSKIPVYHSWVLFITHHYHWITTLSPLSWLHHTACYQDTIQSISGWIFWGRFFPQILLQLCSFYCLSVCGAYFLRHTIPFYSFLHPIPFITKHFILYADNWHTRARHILLIYFIPHYFCAQIASCSQVLNYK